MSALRRKPSACRITSPSLSAPFWPDTLASARKSHIRSNTNRLSEPTDARTGLRGTVGRTFDAHLTPLGAKPPLPAPHTLFLRASLFPSRPSRLLRPSRRLATASKCVASAFGGRGRRGKFKHVESDAMEGVNRKRRCSVIALTKRRDSRVDAVLELRPPPPPALVSIRAIRGEESCQSCESCQKKFASIRGNSWLNKKGGAEAPPGTEGV